MTDYETNPSLELMFICESGSGINPVDTLWLGEFGGGSHLDYIYSNSRSDVFNIDSAIGFSYQNITLAPNQKGEMVVGNMGAEKKMDYTIMGNAVNLASRIGGVNKYYHTGGVLISEYTRAKIGDEFMLRRIDRVRVVGINTPLRLYELLPMDTERSTVEIWEKALDLYEHKDFRKAFALFVSLLKRYPSDNVARVYAHRCKAFVETPPPEDWDAVKNLTNK